LLARVGLVGMERFAVAVVIVVELEELVKVRVQEGDADHDDGEIFRVYSSLALNPNV
jgi:hypothetical protein